MQPSLYNLHNMNSNTIINSVDALLKAGYTIDDIVSSLDGLHIIANYNFLRQKGAEDINLSALLDTVKPVVILNNLSVFEQTEVPVDYAQLVSTIDGDDALRELPSFTSKLLALGVAPQLIADKCMTSHGPIMYFFQVALPELLEAGARVDGDKLVDKLLEDEEMIADFNDAIDIPLLERAGASQASLKRLQTYVDAHTIDDAPSLEQLSINIEGKQTVKIFFKPQIQVVTTAGGRELEAGWAGRVLPGQTLKEGIAAELQEVYGYTGRFEFWNLYFLDYAKDKTGQDIERYGMYITLYPSESDTLNLN
jgi:hypothetical protein